MNADLPQACGPFVVAFEPAEIEAVSARYGLRAALGGGLTASHQAPLAAFVLTLLFAAILALTGFISRRAGDMTFLIAASAYMVQRLMTHRRIWRARNRGRAEVGRLLSGGAVTTTIDADGATQTSDGVRRRIAFADCEGAEEANGLFYLWPQTGAPVVMPRRVLGEEEALRLAAFVKAGVRRTPITACHPRESGNPSTGPDASVPPRDA